VFVCFEAALRMAIKVAVLTGKINFCLDVTCIHVSPVSDSVAQNAATDKSGPAIEKLLQDNGAFVVVAKAVVPDDIDLIRKTVRNWAEEKSGPALVLTTGGTGFGVRDRTPEVILI
jgi:gephyrin